MLLGGAAMNRFEYEVTKHPAEEFSELIFFCSTAGECSLEQVPDYQTNKAQEILNERGSDGWELVQMSFGRDGIVAFWKRAMSK